jgi:hypothetical protein
MNNILVKSTVKITDPKLIAWLEQAAEHNTRELEKLTKEQSVTTNE